MTCGDPAYSTAIGAIFDQVVNVQMTVQTTGDDPVGGLGALFTVRSDGDVSHISGTVSTPSAPEPSSTADVFLGRPDPALALIPGSVTIRRNVAASGSAVNYQTAPISDSFVGSMVDLPALQAGDGGALTVAALFRVMITSVELLALVDTGTASADVVAVTAGDDVELVVRVENNGNTAVRGIVLDVALPDALRVVATGAQLDAGDLLSVVADPATRRATLQLPDLEVDGSHSVSVTLVVGGAVPTGTTGRVGVAVTSAELISAAEEDELTVS